MNTQDEIALLRRFEPIVRYTRGEQFFPMDVEPYIRACGLWVQRPEQAPVELVPAGQLTPERLAQPYTDEFGAVYYLKIPDASVQEKQRAAQALRPRAKGFRSGVGRLARVGYLSRFVDAIFGLGMFARGRAPADSASSAYVLYRRAMSEREHYRYHGRVVREQGWIALQYWFFYTYNDWRSGFYGVNDHEADWEMIYIYLSKEAQGELRPEWVAYAAHDFIGDELRRRWDDPEFDKVGEHPVIYAGAGSHGSYFARGEYMIEANAEFLKPIERVINGIRQFWFKTLRQYEQADTTVGITSIPFVDYARGDGLSIGPGQEKEWDTPSLLEPVPAWASNYRGLWGLYTRDPLGGENAPSGPIYNRDGSIRRSWYDPLGFGGVSKLFTPTTELEAIQQQEALLEERQKTLRANIETKNIELQRASLEAAAMRGQPHLGKLYASAEKQILSLDNELGAMRSKLTSEEALLTSLRLYEAQVRAGVLGPMRAHIHYPHTPVPPSKFKSGRVLEFWSAVSIGLMLVMFVLLRVFAPDQFLLFGLVAIIAVFAFVESGFRGQLSSLAGNVGTALAIVSFLVLIYEFFWGVVTIVVVVAGVYILWDNLRELWR